MNGAQKKLLHLYNERARLDWSIGHAVRRLEAIAARRVSPARQAVKAAIMDRYRAEIAQMTALKWTLDSDIEDAMRNAGEIGGGARG